MALVSGTSGVGKSEFTNEFMRRAAVRQFIRVNSPMAMFDKTVKDGVYVRNFSKQVHRSAERLKLPTMEDFANSLGTQSLTEDYNKRLLESGRKMTLVSVVHSLSYIFLRMRKKFYTAEDLYRPSANWEPIIHRDYIQHALQNRTIAIALENFQTIDHESQILVHDLMKNLPDVFWIIEYSSQDRRDEELRTFDELTQMRGVEAKLLRLTPIPHPEIISASAGFPEKDSKILEEQYHRYGGNLRVLLDTSVLLRDSNHTKTPPTQAQLSVGADATVVLLDSLSSGELFLLAVILANDANIEASTAELIFNERAFEISSENFRVACDRLKNRNIISSEGSFLISTHDRILEAFQSGGTRKLVLSIALNASISFYQSCLDDYSNEMLPKRELASRLLKLYLQTQPAMIFTRLDDLRIAVLKSASRIDAEVFLKSVLEKVSSETGITSSAWWKLAHLCYEANLYHLALEIASDRVDSAGWFLLRGLCLHNLDRNDEGIAEGDAALTDARGKGIKSYILSALLVKMVCNRAEQRVKEVERIADSIEKDEAFRREPEYAFFLQNLESIRDPLRGLELIEESVHILISHRLPSEENKARISLAIQFARLGNLSQALEELQNVERIEELPITDRHMVWNNRCATEMLKGDFSERQAFLLRRARLTCAINFDHIVIGNNMGLWHANRGDLSSARRCFEEIELLVNEEDDPRIRCALFFNQMEIARTARRISEESEYRSKLREEVTRVDAGYRAYWQARASDGKLNNESFTFLLKQRFHYLFLAHWGFPLRHVFEW